MAGLFPTLSDGGVKVRDDAGNPIPVSNVPNAFVPQASFSISCDLTYLYNDCFSRISPSQINAVQSEMLCLASWLDPNGAWDCDSLCNLSTAMENFIANFQSAALGDQLCIVPQGTGTEALPFLIYCTDGTVMKLPIAGPDSLLTIMFQALCGTDTDNANDPTSRILFCDENGDIKSAPVFSTQYYRGDWVQAYPYTASQMVKRNDRLYSPNADIPAGTEFVIGTQGQTWREVSAPAIPPHDPALAYKKDQIVSREGNLWAANADIPLGTQFQAGTSGQTWRLVNFSEAHILEFDPLKNYTRYSVVTLGGLIYRATAAEVAAAAFDPTQWELIGGEKNIYKGAYDPTKAYAAGAVVEVDGVLYKANDAIPANTPFAVGTAGATWRKIGQAVKRRELAVSVTQGWDAGEIIAAYSVANNTTFPVNLDGSKATLSADNLIVTSLLVMRNGVQVASAFIYQNDISLVADSAFSIVPGDILTFQADQAATFNYFSFTMVGTDET